MSNQTAARGGMRSFLLSRTDRQNDKSDWIVLIVYAALLITISAFHEPWTDEAQAWLIARDASYHDMLLVLPHYEGHPALWWLYLSLFAKTGVPYEIGLKAAAIILNVAAMGIFLKKSPFPRIFRWAVPFTYFFFYQYGVVSRCYSITMLGFMLLAALWKDRDKKPFRTAAVMALICASCAYGLVLCAGIAAVWGVEILRAVRPVKKLIRDRRIYALCCLLVFALLVIIQIYPYPDAIASASDAGTPLALRLLYMFCIAPMDALFCTSEYGIYSVKFLDQSVYLTVPIALLFAGAACAACLYGRRRQKLVLLLVPYALLSFFAACVYFTCHHLGVYTIFFLFWAWVCEAEGEKSPAPAKKSVSKFGEKDLRLLKRVGAAAAAIALLIPVYWNVSSSVMDIGEAYDGGKAAADYLKTTGLSDCGLILVEWSKIACADPHSETGYTYRQTFTQQTLATVIAPYFDRNMFYAFNDGNSSISYITSRTQSDEEVDSAGEKIVSRGLPDVIIGDVSFNELFPDADLDSSYALVKEIPHGMIIKGFRKGSYYPVYVRRDLLAKYGLTEIQPAG